MVRFVYRNFNLQLIILTILSPCATAYVEYKNWAFHFPYGSNMGLYMALALPIDVPNENVFVAYNFEANYLLPGNQSETVQFPPIAEEERRLNGRKSTAKLDRATVYRAIERKLDAYGYAGHHCLLKAICEAASSALEHNGVVGDIVHIVLMPSTSDDSANLPLSYKKAEDIGKNNGNCHKLAKNCPTSFLNLITWLKY